ncbi:DUF3726 domain-containing protein [Candidatus Pelagibacter sp.]|nr:DUF3726 domain-containing protein [Candidatus Pelagibacter sp.]
MKSLSEIETTAKRASKAAGFSWGESEEIGKCIRQLEMFGLPGIKHLNSYFHDRQKNIYENLDLIKLSNPSSSNPYCPIILGIGFLDQLKIVENYEKIYFSSIAYPIIFLSFLSRSSEIIGKKINVKFDQKEILLNLNVNIYSNFLNLDFPKSSKNLEINIIENKDNFSDDEWKSLYKLSENTFVEETESLKKGAAGAGLTDND